MQREITAIKVQERNQHRVNIYLDGEFAFGLSQYVAAWLVPGLMLSDSEINKLQEDDSYEVAFQKALQFINHRPRSVKETRKRLSEKGFKDEVIEATLKKLKDKDYLDDFDFARQWIENRNAFRPRSNRLLAYELHLKGVADQEITQALDQFGGEQNELAYQAGLIKAKKCRHETKLDFLKKVGSFLSRRGFHYGIVKPTVERLWNEFSETESNKCLDETGKGSEINE